MNFPVDAYSGEFLVDYGTPFAVDIRVGEESREIEFIPQKHLDCPSGLGLFPQKPSMPLLPPNDYVNILKEPCMEDRMRRSETLHGIWNTFRKNMGCMKNYQLRSQMKELMNRLENLEDIDDEIKVCEFHGLFAMRGENKPKDIYIVPNYTKTLSEKDLLDTDINSDYAGGCVSYHSHDGGSSDNPAGVLIYPCGKDLSKLCFKQASFTLDDHLQLDDAQHVIELPTNGRIFETKVSTAQQQTFAIFRQAQTCSIFQLDPCLNRISDDFAQMVTSHTWPDNDRPSSISISPYIASEFLVSCKNGSVYLWSLHSGREPKLVHQSDNPDTVWTRCHFGGHPRLAVVATQTAVTLHDIGRTQLPSDLLRLPHQIFDDKERIMVMAKSFEPFYHFVALDSHIVVLDERKPNDPVLTWKPWFFSPPQYLDAVPRIFPSPAVDDLLVVSTQKSAETFCFQIHPARVGPEGPYPIQGCGNYWRTSRVDCFARFVAKQGFGRYSTVTSSRLEVPLAGVCAVPHGAIGKRRGVSIVQMTSFGDIFCQDYSVGEDKRTKNKTCSYGPGSKDVVLHEDDIQIAVDWLDRARTHLSDVIAKDVEFYSDSINVSNIFQDILPKCTPLSTCCLCNRHWDKRTSRSTVSDADTCHSCNMTVADSRAVYAAIKEDRVIPMPTNFSPKAALESEELLGKINSDDFKDHESQLLLKLWHDETDIDEMLIKRDEEYEKYLSDLRSQAAERLEKECRNADEQEAEDVCEPGEVGREQEQEQRSVEEQEQEDNSEAESNVSELEFELDGEFFDENGKSNDDSEFIDDNFQNSFAEPRERPPDAKRRCLDLNTEADVGRDETNAMPQRRRNPSTSSTSSVHSVLLQSPGFQVTPSRLRQSPSTSTGFSHSNLGSDPRFAFGTPPQRPGTIFRCPQIKRKQFGMGF